MDKSEAYIKMCDCPEIQKIWKEKDGDFFHDNRLLSGKSTGAYYEEYKGELMGDFGIYADPEFTTWLPRQDQIQEMILNDYIKKDQEGENFGLETIFGVNNMFHHWRTYHESKTCSPYLYRKFKKKMIGTLEQLWLIFLMYEIHTKIWNGKKWIKSKS